MFLISFFVCLFVFLCFPHALPKFPLLFPSIPCAQKQHCRVGGASHCLCQGCIPLCSFWPWNTFITLFYSLSFRTPSPLETTSDVKTAGKCAAPPHPRFCWSLLNLFLTWVASFSPHHAGWGPQCVVNGLLFKAGMADTVALLCRYLSGWGHPESQSLSHNVRILIHVT